MRVLVFAPKWVVVGVWELWGSVLCCRGSQGLEVGGVCIYNCTFQTFKSICTYQQRNCLLNVDCVMPVSSFILFISFAGSQTCEMKNQQKVAREPKLGCSSDSRPLLRAKYHAHAPGPRGNCVSTPSTNFIRYAFNL